MVGMAWLARVPTPHRDLEHYRMKGRRLAAFSAAFRPVLLVIWGLAFGMVLGRDGRGLSDAWEVLLFMGIGAVVALAERVYHRGGGRIVGL